MDNFIKEFNALESQSATDKALLEELDRNIAMKQEAIANMKKELAKYTEMDKNQNEKRENSEFQRKSIMENVAVNLTRAKKLSSESETLGLECANQVVNNDKVQTKLCAVRTQMSKIEELERKLRNDVDDLKQPPALVTPGLITEMRAKQASIRQELSNRMAAFDLTEIVADVQYIQNQRKQISELSKELETKSEILSNLDTESEALTSQMHKLQTDISTLQEELAEVTRQNEIYDRRLNELALEEAEYSKLLESQTYELEQVRSDIATQKQKQAEIEEKVTSIMHDLEEKKTEIVRKEEALKTLEEQANSKKKQMALELENMTKDFQQQLDMLAKQRETYAEASENARKEIEKLTKLENFFVEDKKLCQRIAEKQKELLRLKERHEDLSKKIEEKKKNERMMVEETHRVVNLKKFEYDREIGNLEARIERQNANVIEEEMKATDLERRNSELEAEIELVKDQLSAKMRELEIAKIRYQENMQRDFAQAKGDGAKDSIQEKGKQGQRRRKKESAKKVGNRCEQQQNGEVSTEDRKADRQIVQNEEEMIGKQIKNGHNAHELSSGDNKIECAEEKNEVNKVSEGSIEGDQCSSLRNTNTLASMLAKDFSTFQSEILQWIWVIVCSEDTDDTVLLFELNELRTLSPLFRRNQHHSNKEESLSQGRSEPSQPMNSPRSKPPFKTGGKGEATEPTSEKRRGRGRKKPC
ncbi:hypothetical protein KIN20_010930 [Parelaphostrongylus tenuis]|uniref:Uncharacterized protein n=1 Tax=Parelaphostrongylus tenuis TaxID=148309 RepID=A0AAD5MRE1_PARTN|nr:hypothetical protein KIN20_010930 [Parelaphostrongylus tenuis]